MWLLRERLSYFIEWNILRRVDSLICTPKNWSHSRAIMALDHYRLGLESKSGRVFCIWQVYFTKSCQQIWGCVNQPFILFIHHIWGEKVLGGTVFHICQLSWFSRESPSFSSNLPISRLEHQISRIKWTFEHFCALVWNLVHLFTKFELF